MNIRNFETSSITNARTHDHSTMRKFDNSEVGCRPLPRGLLWHVRASAVARNPNLETTRGVHGLPGQISFMFTFTFRSPGFNCRIQAAR
eukprot:13821798-Alexandrium_andersonii.AAC.1